MKEIIMKKLKFIFMEFIYGGHLLSLGASAIIFTLSYLLEQPTNILLLSIPYFISQVVYCYNHFRELEFDVISNPERAKYIEKQKKWSGILLTIYSVLLLGVLLLSNIPTLLFSLFITLGGILYTDYFKEIGAKRIVGFKNFYTSSFGAITIFIIPLFYGLKIDVFFICLVLFVFMRLIVNAAFFDIKDIVSDKERGLKTFAVVLGKNRTLLLLNTINLGSIIPLTLGIYFNNYPKSYIILGSLAIYSLYYLIRAYSIDGKKLRNLSYMIVDAEYIFWPILIFIARYYS